MSEEEIAANALFATLAQSREMAKLAITIRVKNFNFFVIIVGALVSGNAYFSTKEATILLGIVGFVVGLMFLLLDIRMRLVLERSIDHLEILEQKVWALAGINGWTKHIRGDSTKYINHQWIYRALFIMTSIGSLIIMIRALLLLRPIKVSILGIANIGMIKQFFDFA
ncbi:hypothetical protein FGF66_07140, partial [Chlorobaculum thiosulfatiphilum]